MKPWGLPAVTVDLDGAPFGVAVTTVATLAKCSVSVPPGIVAPVTLLVKNKPAEEVFRTLARQVDLVPRFSSGVVYFEKKGEGAGDLVLVYPGYETADDVADVLGSVLDGARVKKVGGRVAVWAQEEQMEPLRKVVEALDVGPDGWLLDVRVVAVSGSTRRELGLGLSASGDGNLVLGAAAGALGSGPLSGLRAVVAVKLLAAAVAEGREARILTEGALALVEGSTAELQQGEVVPVPQRTVSPEGVVTVTGFRDVKTGFNLRAAGRRVPGGLRLELTPKLSSVAGYVEGAPVVSERSVSGVLLVSSGDWVVLSGLQIQQAARSAAGGGIWGSVDTETTGNESVLVLVRATRTHSTVVVGGGEAGATGAATEPRSQFSGFQQDFFGGLPDASNTRKAKDLAESRESDNFDYVNQGRTGSLALPARPAVPG